MAIPPPPADPSMLAGAIPPPPSDPAQLKKGAMAVLNPSASPLERAMGYVAKEGPPILGGMVGGAAGFAAGGPPGAIAGAALGGAAGRSFQRISEYSTGARDPLSDTSSGNAADIGMSGLVQGAAEGTGQLLAKGAEAAGPLARKLASHLSKIGPNVPVKYGEAVFKDPTILSRAPSPEEMSDAYQAFQRYTGLKGLEDTLVSNGRATAASSDLEGMVLNAANKVKSGQKVDPQELYLASQAASRLRLAARYGEPQAQMAAASSAIKEGKDVVDGALGVVFPEYTQLRRANFESNAREAFSHMLPQTLNMSPAMLRAYTAAGAAGEGLLTGHPAAALALPAISPAAWGLGIRAGAAAAPVVKGAGTVAIRAGAQKSIKTAEDYLNQPNQ